MEATTQHSGQYCLSFNLHSLTYTSLPCLTCEGLCLYTTVRASVPHRLNYGLDVLQIYKSWKFNQAYCIPHLPAQTEMKASVK